MREATESPRAAFGSRTREEQFEMADRGQQALYHSEHLFAWLCAIGAIALGVVAALVGFGVIGEETALPVGQPGTTGGTEAFSENLLNGLLWMIPAISAAILSYSMHRTEHHRRRAPLTKPDSEQAFFAFEHFMAMVAGIVAISLGAVCLAVGYDLFDRGNTHGDGYLWGLLSIGASTLSLTFHTVVHHQMAQEEAYDDEHLTSIVDERIRSTSFTPVPGERSTASR